MALAEDTREMLGCSTSGFPPPSCSSHHKSGCGMQPVALDCDSRAQPSTCCPQPMDPACWDPPAELPALQQIHIPPSWLPSVNLLMIVPEPRSSIKIMNGTGLSADPWGHQAGPNWTFHHSHHSHPSLGWPSASFQPCPSDPVHGLQLFQQVQHSSTLGGLK